MTFEQWVSEWLASKLSRSIKTVITPGEIAVRQDDASDLNKYIRETSISILISDKAKVTAGRLSQEVQNAFEDIKFENFIISAIVQTEQANSEELPASWQYFVSVSVKHRRRKTWQL